jgi:hypothetical protein
LIRECLQQAFINLTHHRQVESTKAQSRFLQDEIFDGRKRNQLIFDFIFKILRPHTELEMNRGAGTLVKEAHAAARKPERQIARFGLGPSYLEK